MPGAPSNKKLAGQADIVINARLQLESAMGNKQAILKPLKENLALAQRAVSDAKSKLSEKDNTNRRRVLVKSQKSLTEAQMLYGQGLDVTNEKLDKAKKKYNSARLGMDRMKNEVTRGTQRFRGWAMSLMFFGMALLRVSKLIRQFGTQAFREINESIEGSTNGFQMMEGTMKYLGFTLGQALEPLIMNLIPIVDKLAEFISKHPGLTRVSVVLLTISGIFFMLLGTLALASAGLKEFGLLIGLAGKFSKGLKGVNIPKSQQNSFYRLGKYLGGAFRNAIKWIRNNPVKMKMGGMLAAIALVTIFIIKMGKRMGGFGNTTKAVFAGLGKFVFSAFIAPLLAYMIMWDNWKLRQKDESGRIGKIGYKEAFGMAVQEFQILTEPYEGALEQTMSIAEIWQTEILPQFNEAKDLADDMAHSFDESKEAAQQLAGINFSNADITNLAGKGLLNEESMGAILYADKSNPNVVDDKTEDLIAALLRGQGSSKEIVIHELNISSDSDNLMAILESLKSYT